MRRLISDYNHYSPTDYKFQDYQLSYESLEQMEKVDSGTLEPLTLHDNQNYDFISDMRLDTVAPNEYEVGIGNSFYKTSRRLIAAEDKDIENADIEDETQNSVPEIIDNSQYDELDESEEEIHTEDKIPAYLVFDALKEATDNIVAMLHTRIKKAPVPVDIYVRYDNLNDADTYSNESEVALTDYVDKVYTIYQMFLTDQNVYIIITADRLTKDYKFYQWDNIIYNGFYATRQEAVNYIKSVL